MPDTASLRIPRQRRSVLTPAGWFVVIYLPALAVGVWLVRRALQ